MSNDVSNAHCLACQRNSADIPLIRLEYMDHAWWICPEHLPILIHNPSGLIGTLPGAERLNPASHDD